AASVKAGLLPSVRAAWRRSCRRVSIAPPPRRRTGVASSGNKPRATPLPRCNPRPANELARRRRQAPSRRRATAGTAASHERPVLAWYGRSAGFYRAPKRKTVEVLYVAPGFSTVEGNLGSFGESGKCWVSRQNP